MHDDTLDILLLLALPASGKSEVRRYLSLMDPQACAQDFHLGPTVQLDDFPYVHMMRRVDDTLRSMTKGPVFFAAADRPFQNPRDWGTLIELVNEDYHDLCHRRAIRVDSAGEYLLQRFESARSAVGASPPFSALAADERTRLAQALESESRLLLRDKEDNMPDTLDGKTLVIEFARGGAQGSPMPLPHPFGYAYSVGRLSADLLARAAVLYIWVTPEESRRKNEARADPDDPGSILHHGVPMNVMLNDYGCDDMTHLIETSGKADHINIDGHGRQWQLPVARFDNREDKTSFVREDPSDWEPERVAALHGGLKAGLDKLITLTRAES